MRRRCQAKSLCQAKSYETQLHRQTLSARAVAASLRDAMIELCARICESGTDSPPCMRSSLNGIGLKPPSPVEIGPNSGAQIVRVVRQPPYPQRSSTLRVEHNNHFTHNVARRSASKSTTTTLQSDSRRRLLVRMHGFLMFSLVWKLAESLEGHAVVLGFGYN